jgi:hypothetical protein
MVSISYDFDNRLKFFLKEMLLLYRILLQILKFIYTIYLVDKYNHRNIISMVIIRKDVYIGKVSWNKIKGDDIAFLEIKPEQANAKCK